MSRIIFVPQYPTKMRYQEWWFWKFPAELMKSGFEVLVLGQSYYEMICKIVENMDENEPNVVKGNFAPIETAISFECQQLNQYMNIELRDDDILFLADLSFPGIFSNVLFHKHPKRMFAYCHATSINNLDYFQPVWTAKYPVEKAHAKMFDAVFVGSEYHELKLNWPHTLVTRLPYPPIEYKCNEKKIHDIVSVSRPTPQKVDPEIEALVEVECDTKIVRKTFDTWYDYYKFLAQSKVLLITAKEETFGYQVIDAILSGCIPIAPNNYSYPELLERPYLYDNREELLTCIEEALDGWMEVPKVLCDEEMKSFYNNIVEVMKG